MGEAAGATDRAFNIQTNSVSAMASKLKNAGSVMLTSLGEKALPYVQDAMQGLIDRMPAITETLGGVIERAGPMFGVMASGISNAVSACAPVVGRIGSMFSGAFAAAQPAIASLRDSFMAVLPTLETGGACHFGGCHIGNSAPCGSICGDRQRGGCCYANRIRSCIWGWLQDC